MNHDPTQFPEPDPLDITRAENRHLAFSYSPHFCVGAPLARLEAPIAFLALPQHLPNLSLTDTVLEYKADVTVRRLKALLFEF